MKRCIPYLIAVALVTRIGSTEFSGVGTIPKLDFEVVYVGADVPNASLYDTIQINLGINLSSATLPSTMATAIRTNATSHGLTVPAGSVIIWTHGRDYEPL
jgi:hypothetical protein